MHIKYFIPKICNIFFKKIHHILYFFSLTIFVLLYRYYYILTQPEKISLFLLKCSVTYIITIFVTTLFHEMGHMIFGLLTNCKFCSMQFFSFTLFSSNNQLIFKKIRQNTINAQCIMIPPIKTSYIPPYLLYNLGGLFFNIIQVILSFAWLSLEITPYFTFILYHLFIHAVCSIALNLFSFSRYQPINDGKIILSLLKDDNTKQAYYWHLQFYKDLQNGVQPKSLLNSPYFKNCTPHRMNIFFLIPNWLNIMGI